MGAIALNESKGFSLIELIMAVAVVGILARIAYPSYVTYVLKSHRSEAINGLLELASREVRYYTTKNTYQTSMLQLGYSADPYPVASATSSSHYYDVSVASVSATGFTLKAVPVGNQVNDTCGTYTYTDLGVKGIGSGTVSDCWKQ